MGKPTLNVGTIHGGLNTNSVPDEARITVDTRTVPGIDHVHLCGSLESLLAPRGARVRKTVDVPSLYTEPANQWVQEVFDACTPYVGSRPEARTITFSTDGDGPEARLRRQRARGDPRPRRAHARAPDRRVVLAAPHRAVGGPLRLADAPLVWRLTPPTTST
jgi:hypothetical protein